MKGKDLYIIMQKKLARTNKVIAESGINENTFYSLYAERNWEKEIPAMYINKLYKTVLKKEIEPFVDPRQVLSEPVSNIVPRLFDADRKNMIVVPVRAFGGFLIGYEDMSYINELERTSFPWVRGECFAFEVEGFSMSPDFPPASFVVTTILEDFAHMQKGREYVLQTTDGIILKQFVKIDQDNKEIIMRSINEEYNPVKPIPLKKVKRVYFVEMTIKKRHQ